MFRTTLKGAKWVQSEVIAHNEVGRSEEPMNWKTLLVLYTAQVLDSIGTPEWRSAARALRILAPHIPPSDGGGFNEVTRDANGNLVLGRTLQAIPQTYKSGRKLEGVAFLLYLRSKETKHVETYYDPVLPEWALGCPIHGKIGPDCKEPRAHR